MKKGERFMAEKEKQIITSASRGIEVFGEKELR
jgi:hypothetical protein